MTLAETSHGGVNTTTSCLRTRLEDEAPLAAATICSRSPPEWGAPTYEVQIGSVKVPGVTLEEIFNYVSPRALEVFENLAFKHDRVAEQARKIKDREFARRNRELAWLKRNVKSLTNSPRGGRVSSGSSSRGSDGRSRENSFSGIATTGDDEQGRGNGRRPRPTYTHLYKKRRARRTAAADVDEGLPRKSLPAAKETYYRPSAYIKPLPRRHFSPEVVIVATATAVNIATPSSTSSSSSNSTGGPTKRRRLNDGSSPLKAKTKPLATETNVNNIRPSMPPPPKHVFQPPAAAAAAASSQTTSSSASSSPPSSSSASALLRERKLLAELRDPSLKRPSTAGSASMSVTSKPSSAIRRDQQYISSDSESDSDDDIMMMIKGDGHVKDDGYDDEPRLNHSNFSSQNPKPINEVQTDIPWARGVVHMHGSAAEQQQDTTHDRERKEEKVLQPR
ncbi:hypothetical protein AAFC00_003524 [Neodothiora populina]|uniref:Uncharacterized protein n=1 Tax=Neodothiora populina TaxID=2781224 RepID=A0ABR3PEG7_9PEZI